MAQRLASVGRPFGRLGRASAAVAVAGCLAVIAASPLLPRKSGRDPALALRAAMGAGDRVVLLNEYDFDLSFYAQLRRPVIVVEDWQSPEARRDNWRKELADAGRFDPAMRALVQEMPANWPALLCDGHVTWVLAAPEVASRYPVMAVAQVVAQTPGRTVWKLPAHDRSVLKAAGCHQDPSGGSALMP